MRTLLTFFVSLAVLCCAEGTTAQDRSSDSTGRITGQVMTADDEQPLPGATIAVQRPADTTIVTGSTADSTGAFSITEVPIGTYTVRVSFVGFATKRITDVRLTRSEPVRELGTITLPEQTAQLQEVEVSAERPAMTVEIDRTVYNTSRQLVTAGGSARDVLRDLPSIQIGIDGGISYRGSEGVVIHINGEPTSLSGEALTSFLQSLPASSVERVEVIPNPSARYEPEGTSGIINIVLKENRTAGWSGGLTGGVGTNRSYNASGNLGYRSSGWNLFATYGFRRGSEDEGGSRFRRNMASDPTMLLDQSSSQSESRRSHTLNTQVDYQATEATSFSMESVLSMESDGEDGRTNYIRHTAGGSLMEHFARITESTSGERSLDTRLSFDHAFAPEGHDLTAELQFESEWEDEDGTYMQRALNSEGSLGDIRTRERDALNEHEQEGSFELDYMRSLGRFNLEAGYDGSLNRLDSDERFATYHRSSDTYQREDVNAFGYTEQIHATYATLGTELGVFQVQGGVRAEQALTTFDLQSTGDAYDNSYFSFFPSAFLTYKQNDAQQVRLSYSKRVERPNTWQLNPLDDNEDPTFRQIGNPSLDPEYVHAFELSLVQQWSPATVTVSPFFRRTINEIEWRETLGPDGVTTVTFENFASSNSYGIEFITSLNIGDWVRGNVNLNAHRVVTDASNVDTDLSNNAMSYSGRANLTFTLGPGLDLQFSQFYRAPMDIAGGRIGERLSSDVALRKRLFDGRASVSLRGSDVFDAMNFELHRRTDTFYTESNQDWGQRQLMVTFSYNFGQGGQEEERGRRGGDWGPD